MRIKLILTALLIIVIAVYKGEMNLRQGRRQWGEGNRTGRPVSDTSHHWKDSF